MEAKYFYERMLGYEKECFTSRKYCYNYENASITIHHKNDESIWFIIRSNGEVERAVMGQGYSEEKLNINDLKGDDFEIFNIVQIIKSGYLVLNTETEYQVKKTITKLHDFIDSLRGDYLHPKKDVPHICGGSCWRDGVTSEFEYLAVNGMELHLRSVKKLCKDNVSRKYYDLHCIPFIKSIDCGKAIHVCFEDIMWGGDFDEAYKKCDKALADLLHYMKEIGIDCKWVECKMKKPVYY